LAKNTVKKQQHRRKLPIENGSSREHLKQSRADVRRPSYTMQFAVERFVE